MNTKIKKSKIIVATTDNKNDDNIIKISKNIFTFRGSENNVLLRTIECISKYKIDYLRICADRVFLTIKK